MTDRLEQLGRQALTAFETLSDNQDARTYEYMAGAVRCLVIMRDQLIAQHRSSGSDGAAKATLDSVNAILSMAIGACYPQVGIRPERLRMTRDALRDLLDGGKEAGAGGGGWESNPPPA